MSLGDEHLPEEEAVKGNETGGAAASGEAAAPGGSPSAGKHGNGNGAGAGAAPHGGALAEEASHLESVARERDEYLLALQRTQADFENYRKRITRQQGEMTARAAADLVVKLLPVLDALDLAEAHFNESLDLTEDGKALRASRAMLMDILTKEGLERVDQRNIPFDPSVHDAVAHGEGDEGDAETMVDEVLRSGYRWKGQPLRPAMVRVRG
ncbi:MAG TPA: nucleotide exchange factor GrpE [Acidimicrobiales bacterium]|jgi:molecular chaperone GrpE|nr:nucleotide exchange factor GrpE [Acidimicrobiales bacterium]